MKITITKCCGQYWYPQYDKDGKTIIEFYCGGCDKTINPEIDIE